MILSWKIRRKLFKEPELDVARIPQHVSKDPEGWLKFSKLFHQVRSRRARDFKFLRELKTETSVNINNNDECNHVQCPDATEHQLDNVYRNCIEPAKGEGMPLKRTLRYGIIPS